MIRADIFLINPVSVIGYATFRVRTFAGAMRHSLVANADLGHAMGIKTGILARPIASGLRIEAANVNAMGTVVFGSRRCYKVLDTWVYSINSSITPRAATHVFAERRMNGRWQLVLLPKLGVAAGDQVTVYYDF